ncbi:MAG: serine/threonine protein kinase, partial [Myxococcales bacterium]|nr:serine/threonine protein kinase [Myxococcales bacterium]
MSAPVREGDILAGKYKVERVLAHGGMGVVVAAIHQQLEQRVALKFLLPEEMKNEGTVGRFLLEAKAAVRLRSEHVARVLDVGTADTGSPYIVMEYLEGRDLSAILADGEPMSVTSAVSYVLQACEAVAEAHALGIVHRDLKPANLFLTHRADGTPCVKVLDFGVSKLVGRDLNMTKTNAVIGTPFYMAPEQLRSSRDADVRSDIWALGMVLYELLTGNVAFERDTLPELCMAIMTMPTPAPRDKRPDIPPALEAVILRALAKEPAQRYPTLAELARALAPFSPLGPASEKRIGRVLGEGRAEGASDVPPPRGPGATAIYASEPIAEAAPAATPTAAAPPEVDAFGVTTHERATPEPIVPGASRGSRWLVAAIAAIAVAGLVGATVTLASRARATGAASAAPPIAPLPASADDDRAPRAPATSASESTAAPPATASAAPPAAATA